MGISPELFPRSLSEIVCELARQKYPTAKALARAWDIDVKTAENVRLGHLGIRTLSNAMFAEGWQFIEPLGAAVTGETADQAKERVLTEKYEGAKRALEERHIRRSRRETLESRTARLVADLDGQDAR
jgi:hypothetical protein